MDISESDDSVLEEPFEVIPFPSPLGSDLLELDEGVPNAEGFDELVNYVLADSTTTSAADKNKERPNQEERQQQHESSGSSSSMSTSGSTSGGKSPKGANLRPGFEEILEHYETKSPKYKRRRDSTWEDISCLLSESKPFMKSWDSIVSSLGFKPSDYSSIINLSPQLFLTAVNQLMKDWREQSPELATPSNLIGYLYIHRLGGLADIIKKEYLLVDLPPPPNPSSFGGGGAEMNHPEPEADEEEEDSDFRSVNYFIGRTQELIELHHNLTNQTADGQILQTPFLVVSGFGGIGKTQLVRFYSASFQHFYGGPGNVRFINAETHLTLKSSFEKLAKQLKITSDASNGADGLEPKVLISKCYEYFRRSNSKSLFIFDNAEAFTGPNGIVDFLPKYSSSSGFQEFPSILVTSRLNDIWPTVEVDTTDKPPIFTVLPLGPLSAEHALNLFTKTLNYVEIETLPALRQCFLRLAEALGGFPLALRQASSYIAIQRRQEFRADLQLLITEFLALLDHEERQHEDEEEQAEQEDQGQGQVGHRRKEKKTVSAILNLTIRKIAGEEGGLIAVQLLRRLAFCDPDNIPLDFIFDHYNAGAGAGAGSTDKVLTVDQLQHALRSLRKYSMVQEIWSVQESAPALAGSGGLIYKNYLAVHRLVQKLVRAHALSSSGQQGFSDLRSLRFMILQALPPSGTKLLLGEEQVLLVNHALTILRHTLEFGSGSQQQQLRAQLEVDEAGKTALLQLVTTEWSLLCQLDSFLEAQELVTSYAAFFESCSGGGLFPDHVVVDMKLKIGLTLLKRLRHAECKVSFGETLQLAQQKLGSHHVLTLDLLFHYGWALNCTAWGESNKKEILQKSRTCFELCYEGCLSLEAVGPSHRITLLAKSGLANLDQKEGKSKMKQALAAYQQIMEVPRLEEILGGDGGGGGSSYEIVLSCYANVLQISEKFQEACSVLRMIHRFLVGKCGPASVYTLIAAIKLVEALLDLKSYTEAGTLISQIYNDAETKLGPHHLRFIELREFRTRFAQETQGNLDAVLQSYEDILSTKLTALSLAETHLTVTRTRFNICQVHYQKEDYEQALAIAEDVYTKRKEGQGPLNAATKKASEFLNQILFQFSPEGDNLFGEADDGGKEFKFKCDVCQRGFKLANSLRRHRLHFHDINEFQDPELDRSNQCPTCGKCWPGRHYMLVQHECKGAAAAPPPSGGSRGGRRGRGRGGRGGGGKNKGQGQVSQQQSQPHPAPTENSNE